MAELNVHIPYSYPDTAQAQLRRLLDDGIEVTFGSEAGPSAETHILVDGRPSRDMVAACPHLQTIIIPWAGIPEQTADLLRDLPHLALHNLHHNAAPVAEYAVALLLTAAKAIVPSDRDLRRNDWRTRYQPSRTVLLRGKTALVLGYGAIGQRVARLCRGLGMRVVATRRSAETITDDGVATIHPASDLHLLLPQTDAMLVCLPHTPTTDRLLGEAELALLPQGALLVNIGRGKIIDEAALYTALRDGPLHAAGLDVWYHYPPDRESRADTAPASYPFHELDNVVMSPHRAGSLWRDELNEIRMEHLARLLNAAARGEQIPNRVDIERGY